MASRVRANGHADVHIGRWRSARFTPAEDAVLLERYEKGAREDVQSLLPRRSWDAIAQRALRLRRETDAPQNRRWAERDVWPVQSEERRARLQRQREAVARNRDPLAGYLLQQSLSQNEVWAAVNGAVSRALPTFVRDDVISEMVADVLEGYLDVGEIKGAARSYVSERFRQSGAYQSRSFDATVGHGDGQTLHDLLAV